MEGNQVPDGKGMREESKTVGADAEDIKLNASTTQITHDPGGC